MTNKLITILLAALALVTVPKTAQAQSCDDYVNAYGINMVVDGIPIVRVLCAAIHVNAEVWQDNPNPAQAGWHFLGVMQDFGLTPDGVNIWAIDPSAEPRMGASGSHCVRWQDENGDWQQRCSEYHTYGMCYGDNTIGNWQHISWGLNWAARLNTIGASIAGFYGQVVPAFAMGTTAAIASILEWKVNRWLEEMDRQRCI